MTGPPHDPQNPGTRAVLCARRPMWLGWTTLLVLLGGFGLWSVITTISGAIIAKGRVEVEQQRQVIQHPDGGVIAEIHVSEGDSVAAGDIILRIDGTLLRSELAIIEGRLSEVRARRARAEAERDELAELKVPNDLAARAQGDLGTAEQIAGQRRLFQARAETLARTMDRLEQRKRQTRAQIKGIEAQMRANAEQLDLTASELADQQALFNRGLAQATRVLALQREQARLSGQNGELIASRAQAEGAITELELQRLALRAQRREDASTRLREGGTQELELAQRQRALAERIARLNVRAPAAGTVLGLQVTTPRAVIRPADPIAYVIPQDRPLVIAARIVPIHIDEVSAGQPVKLSFPAFSARDAPELDGTVALVSADSLTDQATGATYYRAEITISAAEVKRLGRPLLPGMPVDAFIQTTPRTPLAYLVKPFADYFNKAFRET